ncbi:substrate binding domain-containing protein [Acidisphaera sp. L21]|uniref:substrate binding domain-containing protein n=1 Tax=Acidisphaera sp. L21 TaxID=1641851 RepID=UPI001C2068C2|nr:substrate binding domain-containing protein [Acidisphaera sp. L21]
MAAQDPELIARRLASIELWPCASADLAGHSPIAKPTDLLAHNLLAHADRRETWEFRTFAGAIRDIEVEPGIVVPEPDVLKTMLIAGAGIGLLPDFHAANAVEDGRLVRLLPEFAGRSVDAHALYPSHRSLSAKVRVFIDALVDHLSYRGAGFSPLPFRNASGARRVRAQRFVTFAVGRLRRFNIGVMEAACERPT